MFVTQEETKVMRDLVVALQLLLSSFTVTHKPARISVGTTKGWVIGAVDDGTELAIQQATDALRQSAQYLKHVDPEWKHALDELTFRRSVSNDLNGSQHRFDQNRRNYQLFSNCVGSPSGLNNV